MQLSFRGIRLRFLPLSAGFAMLLWVCAASAQREPQTPQQARAELHAICLRLEPQVLAQAGEAKGVFEHLSYPRYCDCVADDVAGRLTPAMLRGQAAAALDRLVRQSAGTCGETAIRAMLRGPGCERMVGSVLAQSSAVATRNDVTLGCGCINQAVEGLHGQEFVDALSDVSRSTNEQRIHGRFITPPSFLLMRMQACMSELQLPRAGRTGP